MQCIRRLFLSNEVFASLAKHYGFQDRILISPYESMQGLRDNQSVLADSWEAFIGALDVEAWQSGRHAELLDWLCLVFCERVFPTIREVGVAKEEFLVQRREATRRKKAQDLDKQIERSNAKKAAKRSASSNLPHSDAEKRQRQDSGSVLQPVSPDSTTSALV